MQMQNKTQITGHVIKKCTCIKGKATDSSYGLSNIYSTDMQLRIPGYNHPSACEVESYKK